MTTHTGLGKRGQLSTKLLNSLSSLRIGNESSQLRDKMGLVCVCVCVCICTPVCGRVHVFLINSEGNCFRVRNNDPRETEDKCKGQAITDVSSESLRCSLSKVRFVRRKDI